MHRAKKKKEEWRTEAEGEWGKASEANQWTAVGQAEAAWEQNGGQGMVIDGRFGCTVHQP